MFAYCLNNPIGFYDDGGSKPKSYDETWDDEDEFVAFPGDIGDFGPQNYNPKSSTTTEAPTINQAVGKTSTALQTYYPPNNGFDGIPEKVILSPGTRLQRIGGLNGRFVALEGTPAEMLSLPYDKVGQPVLCFEVQSPVNALGGRVYPWFGQIGGGYQYLLLDGSVQELVEHDLLKGTR